MRIHEFNSQELVSLSSNQIQQITFADNQNQIMSIVFLFVAQKIDFVEKLSVQKLVFLYQLR